MNPMEGTVIHELEGKFITAPTDDLAWKIVEQFYISYPKDGASDNMWYLTTYLVKNDDIEIEPNDRSNALFFYENFKVLNRALYHLYRNKNDKTKIKSIKNVRKK